MAEVFANLAESTLSGAITDAATSIGVIDGSVFPAGGDYRVVVDREIMICTGRAGNILTVQRGQEGTVAVGHLAGATLAHVLTAASILLIPISHAALSSVSADQHHGQTHAIDGADHTGSLSHADLIVDPSDDHHDEAHTLASHTTRPHSDLTGVGADDHHAKSHVHSGDGSGTVSHNDLASVTSDQHHSEVHTLASHSSKDHADLTSVTADQHHTETHTADEHTTAVVIEDDGTPQGSVRVLNFVGTGVSATVSGDEATIDATAASGTGYSQVLDEGSPLTARGKINFIGELVEATDDAVDTTDVTLPDWAGTADIEPVGITEASGTGSTVPRGDHGHAMGILTTKGDLLTRDSTDPTRLSVGTDGQFLIADSGQAKGIRWFDHSTDTADAHLASAVSVADAGGKFTATDAEGVLLEIVTQLDSVDSAATNHINDADFPHNETWRGCSVYADANEATADNVEEAITTTTTWTERYDTDGVHSGTDGDLTVPAAWNGKMGRVRAQVQWAGTAGGFRKVMIRRSGTTNVASVQTFGENTTQDMQLETPILEFSTGQTFELYVHQNIGALNVIAGEFATWFEIEVYGE